MATPKLTADQRKEVVAHLINGTMSEDALMSEYNISDRQVRYYKNFAGVTSKPSGSVSKEEILNVEVPEETKQEEETPLPPLKEEKEVKNLTSNPEVEVKSQSDPVNKLTEADLDPEVDYCSSCFHKGIKTEVRRHDVACPVCGVYLQW